MRSGARKISMTSDVVWWAKKYLNGDTCYDREVQYLFLTKTFRTDGASLLRKWGYSTSFSPKILVTEGASLLR